MMLDAGSISETVADASPSQARNSGRRRSFASSSTLSKFFREENVFTQLGGGFEDCVLLILQDRPEWLAGWFATMKIGGVATHAYTHLRAADYVYFFEYVQSRVVIVDGTTLDKVRDAARKLTFPVALRIAGADLLPLEKGEYALTKLLATTSPVLRGGRGTGAISPSGNFSGGTTGKPKGASPIVTTTT